MQTTQWLQEDREWGGHIVLHLVLLRVSYFAITIKNLGHIVLHLVLWRVSVSLLLLVLLRVGRFWWTKSPPQSAQKSTLESKPAQKRIFESKSAFLSAQKSAQTSGFGQKSGHMRSFPQKRAHMKNFTQKRAHMRSFAQTSKEGSRKVSLKRGKWAQLSYMTAARLI